MFLTVFYGVLDPKRRRLVYSNAGHPHAFVLHENGGLDRLTATDPPVGFAGADAYGESEIEWIPGDDLLLLFTDGLSDVLASATRGDGEERVLDTVIALRHSPVRLIVDELFDLTVAADPPDPGGRPHGAGRAHALTPRGPPEPEPPSAREAVARSELPGRPEPPAEDRGRPWGRAPTTRCWRSGPGAAR